MTKFYEISNSRELEKKVDELYETYSHVEFVGWHGDHAELFYC